MDNIEKIVRHEIPASPIIGHKIAFHTDLVQNAILNVANRPDNLLTLLSHCIGLSDWQSAKNPADPAILDSMRIIAQASLATYRLLEGGGEPIRFALGDYKDLVCPHSPDGSCVTLSHWIFGLYGALICNDESLLNEIRMIQWQQFMSQNIAIPDYQLLYAQALQAFLNGENNAVEVVDNMIQAVERLKLKKKQHIGREILWPQLWILRSLVVEPSTFVESFRDALLQHKAYSVKELLAGRYGNYFSFRLMGLLALAIRRGLPINLYSDYAPLSLLTDAGYRPAQPG